MTISKALVLINTIKARIKSLEALKEKVSIKERYFSQGDRVNEPQYSVQSVDKLITELNKELFNIDNKIKASNATVEIDVEVKEDLIFAPLS